MNDLLSLLDSLPSDAVPSQCLTIADFLGERGDREAEGWMALGALGKQPARWGPLWNWNNRTQWTWLNPFNRLLRHFSEDNAVRIEWHRVLRDATHGDLL